MNHSADYRRDEQQLLWGADSLDDLVERSIALLRENAPTDGLPYWLAFSGGKDSIVIKALADLAGVPYEAHYSVTTIDPPEVFRFIRQHHPDVICDRPAESFFRVMERKGFPTRRNRWCCDVFKEHTSPDGQSMILGIRAEESSARAARWSEVGAHFSTGGLAVLPILHWSSADVWEFIHREGLPYPSLYDEGFHRLGCIGCPMAREAGRRAEFARWPAYERRWRLAFRRIWEARQYTIHRDGREWFGSARFGWARWTSRSGAWFWDHDGLAWERMWEWWVADRALPEAVDGPQQQIPGIGGRWQA